ncbi:MAG: nucleotidyl transferase AbiEii/AbiGii toxin family protein [Fibrobacterota bacterium]
MELSQKPDVRLAKRVLPAPLYRALSHLFAQNISDCILVGGTALSGFYAGHRRSDDLDLFVKDDAAFAQARLALKSLQKLDTQITETARSNQYVKAVCNLDNHSFTVDIVLDENLFRVGGFNLCENKVAVADLATLFMMKSAALLSRCSEKDLYDLAWLFDNLENISVSDMVAKGVKIDAGIKPETVLYSVSSSQIRKEACGFSLDPDLDAKAVHARIEKFRKRLIRELTDYIRNNTTSGLKPIVDTLRKLYSKGQPR